VVIFSDRVEAAAFAPFSPISLFLGTVLLLSLLDLLVVLGMGSPTVIVILPPLVVTFFLLYSLFLRQCEFH